MGRLNLVVAFLAIGASTGTATMPVASLESELLKAALSSGFIGLMLLWFIYQSRAGQQKDHEEAMAREIRLADRLSKLEDETRNKLIGAIERTEKTLNDFNEIAKNCKERINS